MCEAPPTHIILTTEWLLIVGLSLFLWCDLESRPREEIRGARSAPRFLVYIYIYIYMYRRLGEAFSVDSDRVIVSFRSCRACVRASERRRTQDVVVVLEKISSTGLCLLSFVPDEFVFCLLGAARICLLSLKNKERKKDRTKKDVNWF